MAVIIWTKDIRRGATAPKDGSRFVGIPKYKVTPSLMCFDKQMGCFLTEDFELVDYLAGWLPNTVFVTAPHEALSGTFIDAPSTSADSPEQR